MYKYRNHTLVYLGETFFDGSHLEISKHGWGPFEMHRFSLYILISNKTDNNIYTS